MKFDWADVGKSIKVVADKAIVYGNYPGSDSYKVLPKGAVRGKITSINKKDGITYLQLNDDVYISSRDVEIVDNDTKDESSIFGNLTASVSTVVGNASNKIENSAGYISDGIKATKERSFFEMLDYAGTKFELFSDIKKALIVGGVMFGFYLIASLILKAK